MNCNDGCLIFCLHAASQTWCWAVASPLVLLGAEAGSIDGVLLGWVNLPCPVHHCIQPPVPILLMSELTKQ